MNDNSGFELHGLQKLFATSASTVVYTGRFLFDPLVIREYVIAEVARIKHRLIEKALTIEGEDVVRRYVRLHQYAIVAIMDKLFQRSDQEGALECCYVLDDLLSYVNQHFPQYFDELARAPMKHIHEVRIDIALCFGFLKQKLLGSAGAVEPLAYIILDPLHRFYTKGEEQRVSFSRLRYLRYVLEHSKKVVQDRCDPDYYGRRFIEMMLYLNYNSRKTFIQFVQFLQDFLPAHLDFHTRIHNISEYLKIASQSTVKPNTGYHLHSPTLKSQMIDYLAAELKALCDKKAEEEAYPVRNEEAPTFKVKLNLSVAQLACWLRLCIEAGLIAMGNTSELLRFVALHCETKRAGQISAESLRIKFYDIEEGTRRAVQEKLTSLMKSAEGLFE